MKTFAFSELNRHRSKVIDAALAEPVLLAPRGRPKIVAMSIERFQTLSYFEPPALGDGVAYDTAEETKQKGK